MTQHSLFSPPAEPVAANSPEWTQLHLFKYDRTYRYRIHTDRLRPEHLEGHTPNQYRFELEYLDRDGTWREVRLYSRRDEVWAYILTTGATTREGDVRP